ncbi:MULTISPECIES: hypothetical protein [Paenibacillus]|uniref:hypothetical protein n=1 Tax=Paenibacillus TaxID=44249 RepID=UPI001BCBA26C|nr:hypothetical protein [Paenibacillus dendritiformis]
MDILVSPDPSCPPLANRTALAAATRHPSNQAAPLHPGACACRSEQLKTAVLVVRMKHWLHQQQDSRPAAAISS